MFRPTAFFIGLRYTRAKRRNHFISFVSLMSMFGIALGVLVLITVLSVMNGFDREIKKRVFSMAAPITVSSVSGTVSDWKILQSLLQKTPGAIGVAPFVTAQVMLTNAGANQPVMLTGILPEEEKAVTALADKMVVGDLTGLVPGQFGIILGEELAVRLGVAVGDKIVVVTPQVSVSPAGIMPRLKRFTVVGLFRAGSGFGFDTNLAFIQLRDAQKLTGIGDAVSGLHVNVQEPFYAAETANHISNELNQSARVTTWADQFGALFHAISLEKTMMFFILLLIIAVAVFNLVCSLVMVVNDKESDIAILRTFGATPGMIMMIFVVQGAIIGVIGTLIGIVLGVLLAWNATAIVDWIQAIFHVQFLSSNVYFVNFLPSELQWTDVIRISFAALFLSLLATLYPAWRASRTLPVEALRYE